jgi:putative aldouronate transport system permease protein
MATVFDVIPPVIKKKKENRVSKILRRDALLYLFVLPGVLYFLIFHYIPMYGLQIAFKDYSPYRGIWGSPWLGLEQFRRFLSSFQFWRILGNTLGLNFFQLLAGFPAPIVLALLLNQVQNRRFKKVVQTVTYAPHFISTIVMVGIIYIFLSPTNGLVNKVLALFSAEPIFFMARPEMFKTIYVVTGIWQSMGWGAIIYLAALSGINPELYEAAVVDGASRLQKIMYIDIPLILPTVIVMFILTTGRIMDVDFQKVYLMQNPLNLSGSEVISTYVFKVGLEGAQFSFATAVGLFNTLVNLVLILTVNRVSRTLGENSLF